MDSWEDQLDQLEEILENSKSAPFSNKVSVDKEQIFDIINEIRLNLPSGIRHAQRIIEEHDRIIADARSKAESIIKEGELRMREMADEHEVYKLAQEQARQLMEESKRSARDMRLNAVDYADEILLKTEDAVRDAMSSLSAQCAAAEEGFSETINVLYQNRQELKGGQN